MGEVNRSKSAEVCVVERVKFWVASEERDPKSVQDKIMLTLPGHLRYCPTAQKYKYKPYENKTLLLRLPSLRPGAASAVAQNVYS